MAEKEMPDIDAKILAFELRGGQSNGLHRILEELVPDSKRPHSNTSNALVVLANDPVLAGSLAFNEFMGWTAMMRPPPPAQKGDPPLPGPYPRPMDDTDIALILAFIQRTWLYKLTKGALLDAIQAEASRRRFHPVKEWLKTLKWDGVPRLDNWLFSVFGVEVEPPKKPSEAELKFEYMKQEHEKALKEYRGKIDYHLEIGAKVLIAAVRRVMQPGCKFDHMIVLEGPQGLRKSTALRELIGPQWFSDSLHPDLTSRDAPMTMRGKWAIELAELQHFLKNGDETIKGFIARQVDTYRKFQGAAILDVPRQSIFFGTTNSPDWARDTTGNRRFWPVACKRCDIEWLIANREQLWAEAAAREAAGETIWIEDPDVMAAAETSQIERMQEDSWAFIIEEKITGKPSVRISEVLTAIGVPVAQHTRSAEMRVANVLKGLDWTRKATRVGSSVFRVWHAPQAPEG